MAASIAAAAPEEEALIVFIQRVDSDVARTFESRDLPAIESLAESLGVPESTIRSRMARLVEANVIEFVALTNPLHLGHAVWVMMEISVVTRRIRQVAAELSAIPEIYFVYITTGGFDIFAGATFSDNTEMVDFITNTLSQVDGIVRVNTRTILEVHKRVFKFRPRASAIRGPKAGRKGAGEAS